MQGNQSLRGQIYISSILHICETFEHQNKLFLACKPLKLFIQITELIFTIDSCNMKPLFPIFEKI